MKKEQSQRAVTAFQDFLNTPLDLRLNRYQNDSAQTAVLSLFRDVAAQVPAYKAFLTAQNIDPASIQTFEDFQTLPLITKENYLQRHPLAELCRGGQLET